MSFRCVFKARSSLQASYVQHDQCVAFSHYRRRSRAEDIGVTYANLTNPRTSEPLLDALREERVPTLEGNDFVIHGAQTTVPKMGSSSTFPQAWWCRLVEDVDTVLMQQKAWQ